jgi:hypothetical protein
MLSKFKNYLFYLTLEEFCDLIRKKYEKWELFKGYVSIDRKGRIVDVRIPSSQRKNYLFDITI